MPQSAGAGMGSPGRRFGAPSPTTRRLWDAQNPQFPAKSVGRYSSSVNESRSAVQCSHGGISLN
eukprot:2631446-Prymnesium_polylepis.1